MDALYLLTWTFLDIGNSFVFIRYCIVVIVVVLLLLLFMLMCSMFRRRANDSAILGLYLRLAVIAVPSDLASIGLPQDRDVDGKGDDSGGESSVCEDHEGRACVKPLPQQHRHQHQHHHQQQQQPPPSLRSSFLAARDYLDTFCLWTDVVVLLAGLEALGALPVPRAGET